MRRLDLVWEQDEIAAFDQLQQQAQDIQKTLPDFVKAALQKHLQSIAKVGYWPAKCFKSASADFCNRL